MVNITGATLKNYTTYLTERAASSDGVTMTVGLNGAETGVVAAGLPGFKPITDFGATAGASASATTTRLNVAVAAHKLLYIPAGAWRFNALTGSDDVTWLIDPEATFPDLPTEGGYNLKDLSNLGGRVIWTANNATSGMGTRFGSGSNWAEALREFSLTIGEVSVVSSTGQIGLVVATRSSDNPAQNMSTIAFEGLSYNDNIVNKEPAWVEYIEGTREDGAGAMLVVENDVVNKGTTHSLTPYTVRDIESQDSIGYVFASGGGDVADATTASAAGAIWSNGAEFERGFVFMNGCLDAAGPLEAVAMQNIHRFAWYDAFGLLSWHDGQSGVFTSRADADNSGYAVTYKRRKANNTSATDSGDRVWRSEFYGYTGSVEYAGAYAQAIQRTDFSGGNARFSYDISAKNAAGADVAVSLNGLTDDCLAPALTTTLLGSTAYPWASVSTKQLNLVDGITAPATVAGVAQIYVDVADGDLKIKFGDGTVKTIVVDT